MSDDVNTNNKQLAWEWSDSIAKIAPAFVKAQAAIKAAPKNNVNDHFNNRYADLAAVDEASRPALNASGIGVLQFPATAEAGKLGLTTLLLHESGEWISATGTIPLGRDAGPQGFGSAMTYARRYFLSAMVGVCPEDDDANAANGDGKQQGGKNAPQQRQQRQQAAAAPVTKADAVKLATPEQVSEIVDLLNTRTVKGGLEEKWLSKAGVDRWEAMPADAIAGCIKYVKEKGTPKPGKPEAAPAPAAATTAQSAAVRNAATTRTTTPVSDLMKDHMFWSAARATCQQRGIQWEVGMHAIGANGRVDHKEILAGCDLAYRQHLINYLATADTGAIKKLADDYAATQNKAA